MVLAITLAVMLVPKIVDTGNENTIGASKSSFASTMPKDAAKSSTTWFVNTISSMDGKFDTDFFSTEKGSKTLDSIANGDFSSLPSKVQNSFVWTKDAQGTDRTIPYVTLEASAYTGIILAWQLRTSALKENPSLETDLKTVSVDADRGLVYVPGEALCGVPVDITFELKWTGNEWKIDGDMLGNQLAAKARNQQLQSDVENKSTKNNGSTTTK